MVGTDHRDVKVLGATLIKATPPANDTAPPAVSLSFPANAGSYRPASWSAGCAPTGLCGSATDATGVSSVKVSVRQGTGQYWNGSSFASASEVFNAATLSASGATSTAWKLGLGTPADGLYTVHVRAADTLGNATAASQQLASTFTIDAVAPVAPVIKDPPENPTFQTSGQIHFTDAEAPVTFACSVDSAAFGACTSTSHYAYDLPIGDHCFAVRAADAAGNTSPAASACWTILVKKDFGIKGDVSQPYFPGVTQSLNLSFTNPFNFDVQMVGVSITVQSTTHFTNTGAPNPGCAGQQNMTIVRDFSAGPFVVIVPKNSTRTLSDLSVPADQWPLVQMPNLPTKQDDCKGTTFHFTFTGSATKP